MAERKKKTGTQSKRIQSLKQNAHKRHEKVYLHFIRFAKITENGKQKYSTAWIIAKCANEFGYSESSVEKIVAKFG